MILLDFLEFVATLLLLLLNSIEYVNEISIRAINMIRGT